MVRIYEDYKEGIDILDMDIPTLPPRAISFWAKKSEVISPNHVGVIEVRMMLIYMLKLRLETIVAFQVVS
ncbi:unnamed protein product [Macrosiphum euphorbiae]|uniref:Uncharacterized protein n=1 Tax=Macrosiphum euphorbiae TaxID=13131 RepID=A0AAV0VXE8_9HEMI|nr:unnamed protein product [Macrosiphum euphorbiae]